MRLAFVAAMMLQAVVHRPGDYAPPHPTATEMRRAVIRCGGNPKAFRYERGHQVLNMLADREFSGKINDCVAAYAQRYGVIPLQAPRIY